MIRQVSLFTLLAHLGTAFILKSPLFRTARFSSAGIPKQGSQEGLFQTDGWEAIKKELDLIPVFTCANEAGQPLEYEIREKPSALFFTDIHAAKAELKDAQSKGGEVDLIPVPLGMAFELW